MCDYPFRNVEQSHVYDITWEDVIDCAKSGYTLSDTAHVLDVGSVTRLRNALKKRPDIKAMFPSRGRAIWAARKGYVGNRFTPSNYGNIVCQRCGTTEKKYSNTQKVCTKCRPEYYKERDREYKRKLSKSA